MFHDNEQRKRVLIVDENPSDYQQVIESLGDAPIDVVYAGSAREAMRIPRDDWPDLWIVNVHQNDISGVDLYTMLRSRGIEAPIVLVSNEYSIEEEIAVRSTGATIYLAKPVCDEVFLAAVDCVA